MKLEMNSSIGRYECSENLTTPPWQVSIINTFFGFLWAGYNLAGFDRLLELTPKIQRPLKLAIFQADAYGIAVSSPRMCAF